MRTFNTSNGFPGRLVMSTNEPCDVPGDERNPSADVAAHDSAGRGLTSVKNRLRTGQRQGPEQDPTRSCPYKYLFMSPEGLRRQIAAARNNSVCEPSCEPRRDCVRHDVGNATRHEKRSVGLAYLLPITGSIAELHRRESKGKKRGSKDRKKTSAGLRERRVRS